MIRLIPAVALILGCTSVALSATPPPLTTLHAVAALTNAEAARQPPVAFEATVTYFNHDTMNLFVQEANDAIYVQTATEAALVPGDRVLVQGAMEPSFLPFVLSSNVLLLGHGTTPKPLPVGFDDLVRKKVDRRFVRVRGVIHAADLLPGSKTPMSHLQLLMDGGMIDVDVDSHDPNALKDLLDAEVEVTGAAGSRFDGKIQQTGVVMRVTSLADVKVLNRAGVSPWSLPVTPLGDVITGIHMRDLSQRLRVHGTITYYQPGSAVVLQGGGSSLWIATQTSEPLRIGDVADATGFPDVRDRRLMLTHGEIMDSHVQAVIQPQAATWRQLGYWGRSTSGGHQYDLVSIEGQVVTEAREASQDEYVLSSDGQVFTAIYRHPLPGIPLPPMLQVPLNSKIRVTGICMIENPNPVNEQVPFDILLRSFDDVAVVADPPWMNIRNLVLIIGALLLIVGTVAVRGWLQGRKVRNEIALLGYIETRRSRILEDINGSPPLAQILEQVTELVSCKLKGAPCWCQLSEGAQLGNCPRDLTRMRVVQHELTARSGDSHGIIFAAFHPLVQPRPIESEALAMAAGLATLAIETRRLYNDLVRRSEFDLLTDIHNRFSLETRLDAQIEAARNTNSIFGLIYIDLDQFKVVNDLCGHQTGDIYLQQAAIRMKRQLRPGDVLARLGGDEFAALVAVVRDRDEVDEIAQRLESCFDDGFEVDGKVLRGSASIGIALYPADAITKDSLLSVADTAMYIAKNNKRALRDILARR